MSSNISEEAISESSKTNEQHETMKLHEEARILQQRHFINWIKTVNSAYETFNIKQKYI